MTDNILCLVTEYLLYIYWISIIVVSLEHIFICRLLDIPTVQWTEGSLIQSSEGSVIQSSEGSLIQSSEGSVILNILGLQIYLLAVSDKKKHKLMPNNAHKMVNTTTAWVSDCCLTPTQQFFIYIMWRDNRIFHYVHLCC